MTNFAEYGLILCPHIDTYETRTPEYKRLFKRSVDNIITFLGTKNIKPLMLLTDQVANVLSPSGVNWSQTITEEDLKFAVKNCDNISSSKANVIKYPEFYEAVEVMEPPLESGTDDALFDSMCKRVALLEKAIIQRQTVIFSIQSPNKANYNVKPKEASGVILCVVHNGNFKPTTYIGDMEVNPISMLDYECGNLPVYEWRF